MLRSLSGSGVVVTGASSGIGRATARAFARSGASVVLAARRADRLQEAAEECRQHGVAAHAVPTDVADPEAVDALAARAIDRLGAVDVWVNNAAVTQFAELLAAPLDEVQRLFDVNVFGYLHGARAIVPHFRDRGSGVLVNVSSMVGVGTEPYAGAYTMTKHAVRAMSMILRQELRLSGAHGVRVCSVLPASIDTPIFQHGANHTRRAVQAMPPVYPPEQVARTIVNLARLPRREVYTGTAGRLLGYQAKVAPGLVERVVARAADRSHLSRERPAAETSGTVFESVDDGFAATGGWQGARRQARRRAGLATAAAAALALLALRGRRS